MQVLLSALVLSVHNSYLVQATHQSSSFYGNQNVKSLFLPTEVKLIESYSFAFDSDLEELIIASSSLIIEDHAFYGCDKLKRVIIAAQTLEIKENVFGSCENLQEITFGKSLQKEHCKNRQKCPAQRSYLPKRGRYASRIARSPRAAAQPRREVRAVSIDLETAFPNRANRSKTPFSIG